VNFFWSVTVGWPRLLIIFPALAIALFKAAASGVGWHWSIDAAWWVFCSIPLFLLVWAGTSYWWKRHRTVAMIATTTIVLEILTLGLMIE
jgi:hypothetical protein